MNKKKVEHIKKLLRKKVPEFATRVVPIFVILNWKWWDTGVPTRTQIIEVITKHIDKLSEEICSSGSGGLEAEIEEDKSLGGYLTGIIRMKIEGYAYEDEEEKMASKCEN